MKRASYLLPMVLILLFLSTANTYSRLDSIMQLKGHTSGVLAVEWSPDDSKIATASADSTIKIWDSKTGKLLVDFRGHTAYIRDVVWSPDGENIASVSDDKSVIIWDVIKGEKVKTLLGHKNRVNALDWHPNGEQIISAGEHGIVRVWDVKTGEQIKEFPDEHTISHQLEYNKKGDNFLELEQSVVYLWDTNGTEVFRTSKIQGTLKSACYSPDANHILTLSSRDDFYIHDAHTGTKLRVIEQETRNTYFEAIYSPDEKYIIARSYKKGIDVWEVETGELIDSVSCTSENVYSISFNNSGTKLAVGLYESGGLDSYANIVSFKPLSVIESNNNYDLEITAQSREQISISYNCSSLEKGIIKIYDLIGNEVITLDSKMQIGNSIENIDISALSNGLYLITLQTSRGIDSKKFIVR